MMYSATLETTNFNITDLLHRWLTRQLPEKGLTWVEEKRQQIKSSGNTRVFFTAFSSVPRYTGKNDLALTPEDLKAADSVRTGWFPRYWSVDQAARTLLVLSLPQENTEKYLLTLTQLFTAADVGELVALYQALPLLPYPEKLRSRAAEGIRSNMTAVFNAVALQNPYPVEYLDNLAWNQMVLKALFVGSPLHLIQGLDQRTNAELAKMASNYAHERWAAHRSVSPELWRLVGKFADTAILSDLEQVLAEPHHTSNTPLLTEEGLGERSLQQAAAAIACAESPLPQAQTLLARYPDLQAQIHTGRLTWNSLIRGVGSRE